jgi:hypothetical protein
VFLRVHGGYLSGQTNFYRVGVLPTRYCPMIAKAGAYKASPKYGVCNTPKLHSRAGIEIHDSAAGRLILGKL